MLTFTLGTGSNVTACVVLEEIPAKLVTLERKNI